MQEAAQLNEITSRPSGNEKHFRMALRHSADAIIVIDPNQDHIVEANAKACSLLGYERREILKCKLRRIHPLDMPALHEFMKSVIAQGCAWTDELSCTSREGEVIPAEISASAVKVRDKTYVVAIVRSVSERRAREEFLRHSAKELEAEVQARTCELRIALAENERLKQRVEAENVYLREELHSNYEFKEIVGRSTAIAQVLRLVGMVAPTDANVLITGESGTGKELVARAIHDLSTRKTRPFIKVNCAAIPRELFESEFFGHVRGAFTGAHSNRTGRFELANGGTLFLDEIGELPLDLQTKLLGVLQEGRFERVGDGKPISVDVRVIAATNRNLEIEIAEKRFRLDLFYRLNIFPITVPPLRERSEDIVPLAEYILGLTSRRLKRGNLQLSEEHHRQLRAYDWPGNVRELQNVIERAVILARGGELPRFDVSSDVPSDTHDATANHAMSNQAMAVVHERQRLERDKRNIENALRCTRGRIAGAGGAAELLGVKPSTLRSRIKAYRIAVEPSVVADTTAITASVSPISRLRSIRRSNSWRA